VQILGDTDAAVCRRAVFKAGPRLGGALLPEMFNVATGLYCPGCGTLRALTALGELDFRAAFMYNPFLFLMAAPLAVYMCAIFLLRAVTGRQIPSILSSKAALPTAAVVIAVFAVRNIFHV